MDNFNVIFRITSVYNYVNYQGDNQMLLCGNYSN